MRAHIARALMSRPALLILDEPTSGLDLPMREGLLLTLAVIARSDDAPAILLVTHHLDEIPPAATHAVLMSTGRVHAAGAPRDVLRSDLMSEAFRFPIAVTRTEDDRFYAHSRATAIE
jgi:iron complex transport system ATP-binding protein